MDSNHSCLDRGAQLTPGIHLTGGLQDRVPARCVTCEYLYCLTCGKQKSEWLGYPPCEIPQAHPNAIEAAIRRALWLPRAYGREA